MRLLSDGTPIVNLRAVNNLKWKYLAVWGNNSMTITWFPTTCSNTDRVDWFLALVISKVTWAPERRNAFHAVQEVEKYDVPVRWWGLQAVIIFSDQLQGVGELDIGWTNKSSESYRRYV